MVAMGKVETGDIHAGFGQLADLLDGSGLRTNCTYDFGANPTDAYGEGFGALERDLQVVFQTGHCCVYRLESEGEEVGDSTRK